jgi:hypothetical protein
MSSDMVVPRQADVSYGSMLLKKAKMNRPKFLPVRPPKPALCNPTHYRELTKALVGNRADYMSPYIIFGPPPVPLKKSFRPPEMPFSTASVNRDWAGQAAGPAMSAMPR